MSLDSSDVGVLGAADVSSWDDEADVVVVGCGGAGVCAAISAREAGAETFVLERGSGLSGTTTIQHVITIFGG